MHYALEKLQRLFSNSKKNRCENYDLMAICKLSLSEFEIQ